MAWRSDMPYVERETVDAPEARPADFEGVVRPHLEYLYSLAVRLSGHRSVAEDLVQDTLLRAFRGFARLRNRERPRLWLTRILTRCHYDRFRSQHEAEETVSLDDDTRFDLFDRITEEDPFPYSDRVHLDFLELFDDMKIIEALQRLHPAHRTALILAYVYGYTAREIGEITGASVGTVLARLFRGRKQLERELWEYAQGHNLITRQEVQA
jgi:RNA polymerase sigma-70 factor, ECF subfamily